MHTLISRSLTVLAPVLVAAAAAVVGPNATATAEGTVTVYPGMEIRQANTICTLGYIDPVARVGFSAGHCSAEGPVTDKAGRAIGTLATSRDNTPDGTIVTTDQTIIDYETIVLAPGVAVNNVLPGGRMLVTSPTRGIRPGEAVCHYGVVTGETCGTVDRVFNGWFTMANGVVSRKGDSGGPVYVLEGDSAVLIGLFNCTWGTFPAAVSWQAAGEQIRADAVLANNAASAVNNASVSDPAAIPDVVIP